MSSIPPFSKVAHAKFSKRCLNGLPASALEADPARVVVGFYALGAMDLLGLLDEQTKEEERDGWREWIWSQQITSKNDGGQIGGFRPSTFMHIGDIYTLRDALSTDSPHLVATYTALISLAILRDDFSQLNRAGVLHLIRKSQLEDGSFTAIPGQGEADMRMVYTAFAISSMLDDWSGFDVAKAIDFIKRCITYEGGFGQARYNEAQGGPTYCAIASLHLAPEQYRDAATLSSSQTRRLTRWLVNNQHSTGGFCGRTGKIADACYCFWCGAALKILGVASLVDSTSNANFLYACQFKYGGIAKAPYEHPDPYHTYLALAALAIYPPQVVDGNEGPVPRILSVLDPLLNASEGTAKWIREYVPSRKTNVL